MVQRYFGEQHLMRTSILLLAALFFAPSVHAGDLSLAVHSAGVSSVTVAAGDSVSYRVVGELSDAQNEGLALFCFDLDFSGGPLAPAATPTRGPLLQFAAPRGVNNPAGFGGTPVNGGLVQVGGGQNTIRNVFAPVPIGQVVTGVGAPGSPAVLVEGTVTAPMTPGLYVLSASDLVANVIRAGEDGSGSFWAVEAAGVGSMSALTIEVLDCGATTYCTAKTASPGCVPKIGWSGTPSLSGPDDFVVTCTEIVNQQTGLWFFGAQPGATPFFGGTLCVSHPIRRARVLTSGGDVGGANCSGSFALPVSQQFMASHPLEFSPGSKVYGQWWFRDPSHPDGTGVGLSDALEIIVCP